MRKSSSLSITSRVIIIVAFVLVVCLVLAVGTYFFIVSRMFSRFYEPDLIISSPDGKYELVVREWSCLGGSGADVYIRGTEWYDSWNKKEIGTAIGDDGYQPFSNGTYYVEWKSNKVTIYYYQAVPIENVDDSSTWRGIISYEFG